MVKPDQLIKRRGKLGLVGINLTLDQVKVWLKQRLGQETTVSATLATKPDFFIWSFLPACVIGAGVQVFLLLTVV